MTAVAVVGLKKVNRLVDLRAWPKNSVQLVAEFCIRRTEVSYLRDRIETIRRRFKSCAGDARCWSMDTLIWRTVCALTSTISSFLSSGFATLGRKTIT